jgi:hypothetical protein
MKKLRLDLEELAVESFEVREEAAARGTVKGHGSWDYCEPSIEAECPWTGNPVKDCWPAPSWAECTFAC